MTTRILPPNDWPEELLETTVFNGGLADQRVAYMIEDAILHLCSWGHQWAGVEFGRVENQGRTVAVGSAIDIYLELPPYAIDCEVHYQAEAYQSDGTEQTSNIRFRWGSADVTHQLVGRSTSSTFIDRDDIRWRVASLPEVGSNSGLATANGGGGRFTIDCPAGSPTGFQLYHMKVRMVRSEYLEFDTGGLTLELKSGAYGSSVLTDGTATATTLIDLTGVAEQDDIAVIILQAQNNDTSGKECNLWKNSGGTEHWSQLTSISTNQSGFRQRVHDEIWIRVTDPAASLWYSWSASGSVGLSAWVKMLIKGVTWS